MPNAFPDPPAPSDTGQPRAHAAIAIAFEDLQHGFASLRVLDRVSGAAAAGEVLAVTGPNGAGKSTLLRILAGLLAAQAGTVELRAAGRALDAAERRAAIGYVAPDVAYYDELSVEENLRFFARLRRSPPERAIHLARRFGLPLDRPHAALSSGMRQRLRWTLALPHDPLVLLLDEPFQNLDSEGETIARELLAEHVEHGPAVVASPTPLDLPRVTARLRLDR